ncbi:MAG: radical SAM family heme chaperone HemW [Alistipes sp.]|nr:radical SAM family heme chaperone HemW [Alistipes sp.]MDE7129758.1 radical SAM family heme chaperone HemW [Alistipes sp.]
MSLLYIHIPYCKRICSYCDFYRTAALRSLPATLDTMHREMHRRRDYLADKRIRTVYFGGGTPSLAAPEALQRLIDTADTLWDCGHLEEVTVEANPDDITRDYVAALRRTAVDRVSLGIQSFDDRVLRLMNRRHTAAEATDAVKRLQDAGYENMSIDLIFGIDGFGGRVLDESLQRAAELSVAHVSAYHLTIEPRTLFARRVEEGKMHEVGEDVSEREFGRVHDILTDAGYEHYEVSNYAMPGHRARHNSAYWTGEAYLGIGPGAHSFDGDRERCRCSSTAEEYSRGEIGFETETLSPGQQFDEYVMVSLRCAEGIDMAYVESRFGSQHAAKMLAAADRWLESGDLIADGGRLRIPPERFLISDAVIESLFE